MSPHPQDRRPARRWRRYADDVNLAFDRIGELVPEITADREWLAALRHQALRKKWGWKAPFDAYLAGLAAAGRISREDSEALRRSVREEICTLCAVLMIFAFPAWVIGTALATLSGVVVFPNGTTLLISFGLLASVLIWAVASFPQTRPRRMPRWLRSLRYLMIATGLPIAGFGFSQIEAAAALRGWVADFDADRKAFMADPQGYPILRQFALENYGVDIIVGTGTASWAATALRLPDVSPASMGVGPGYCGLVIYRKNLSRVVNLLDKENQVLFTRGVLMHELAHCLDGKRDYPAFDVGIVHTHSVAPADADAVTDVASLEAAGDKASTKLWREALADIFAVGYWRLTSPEVAEKLTASLRGLREKRVSDKNHSTMCWIDYAVQSDPPASAKELLDWADDRRRTASCAIEPPLDKAH